MRDPVHTYTVLSIAFFVLGISSANAYRSSEEILWTARREGRQIAPREWVLPVNRCVALTDIRVAAEECRVTSAANGIAAFISFITACGGDICDGQTYFSLAKNAPRRLPTEAFGGGHELLPAQRAIVFDHLVTDEHHRTTVRLQRLDLAGGVTTSFAECESPILSPGARWIVCRADNGDVLRVSVSGGRPKPVHRIHYPNGAAPDHLPYKWILYPEVAFLSPTQFRVTTPLKDGDPIIEAIEWRE